MSHFSAEFPYIDKLRGKIEIQSTLGQGSVFTIFFPLTLAIIDGLIVSVGSERYILPTLCERIVQANGRDGAAILGDGRVGLILDVNALVKLKGFGQSRVTTLQPLQTNYYGYCNC